MGKREDYETPETKNAAQIGICTALMVIVLTINAHDKSINFFALL